MKRSVLSACLLIVLLSLTEAAMAQSSRSREKFNKDWQFKLDSTGSFTNDSTSDAGWRTLNLPHDWSIEGSFDEKNPATPGGGALPGGVGWYRKTFTIAEADKRKRVSVQFDGVYHNSEVWINGHYLGKRPNGYISFEYDLTDYLNYGTKPNIIAVKVDNSRQPNSRWYSGSGIYRNVWLVTTNRIFIPTWGNYISTSIVTGKQAKIRIETKLCNTSGKAENVEVNYLLKDKQGGIVASAKGTVPLPVSDTSLFATNLTVANPKLWSVDDPNLYEAVTQVTLNGRLVDEVKQAVGIRYFAMDKDKGFFLNGKHLKILGVCDHHDLGCLGAAINTRAIERQLQLLKGMGCNGIRTSHNPPAPELLELCDKMGFIVMDEAFDMWKKAKNPFDYHLDWDEWHEKDLVDFVLRDRNHPSVMFWSVGNEIPEQWGDVSKGDTSGRSLVRELVAIVHKLDTTRPVVTANNEVQPSNQLISAGATDVIGINYHHQLWPSFPTMFPGKKLIVTESVSALETRGHYDLVPADSIRRWPEAWDKVFTKGNPDFTVSAYDHVSAPWGSTHEETWRTFTQYDFISGMFIWTGFDYIGEPTPYPWPARSSYFGIIDLAGFPKDVYYLYRSEATNKPTLHLLPHWNWSKGDTVDVVAYYNNADAVELFLNGKSLGRKSKTDTVFHVQWRLPYAPGVVKAVSYKNGRQVLSTETKTAGEVARMIVTADRKLIKADGEDLSFITVKLVDKNGAMVPRVDNAINFSVTGAGILKGTDNGNPVSHESFLSSKKSAFNGLCLGVVQSTGVKGKVVVNISAEGLPPVSLSVDAK